MRTKPAWRLLILATLAALAIACGDTIINVPTEPTPKPAPVLKHTVQFRVLGNASSARIRYSTPVDGLGQVVTSLPYFNTLQVDGAAAFLSLEATPVSYGYVMYPFLSVQIAVDNVVFREATSADFQLLPLSASGQWRQ
jgi:hypothetical protein